MGPQNIGHIGNTKSMFFGMCWTSANVLEAGSCQFTVDVQARQYLTCWNCTRVPAHRFFTGSLEPCVNWIGLLLLDVGLALAQRC